MNTAITGLNGWRREADSPAKDAQPRFEAALKQKMSAFASSSGASDLRRFSPQRHDQATSNSCAAQSTIRATEIKRIMKVHADTMATGKSDSDSLVAGLAAHVPLSRLALYFLAREAMDPPETGSDDGTFISIAAEILRTFGVARETQDPSNPADKAFWPFDLSKVLVSPSWLSVREASLHKISAWYRIGSQGSNRVDDVIAALAAGNPVVYGTVVGDAWRGYNGTTVLGPVTGPILGRHATVLVGWDPQGGFFWDENSWGTDWGENGFAKMAPEVISSPDSEDFVVIQGGWEPWHSVA